MTIISIRFSYNKIFALLVVFILSVIIRVRLIFPLGRNMPQMVASKYSLSSFKKISFFAMYSIDILRSWLKLINIIKRVF